MKNSKNGSASNEQSEWEMRPGGMTVQKRDDGGDDADSSESMIKIKVAHGPAQYVVDVPAQSTFGELKKAIANESGIESQGHKVLFRGKEKEDDEHLHTSGVKNKSKVLLLDNPTKKEDKKPEEIVDTAQMGKAIEAVAGVRVEIDKLSERVAALEVAVNAGTKVDVKEFDVSAELLMKQLLKLDGIEADGEAKQQRKAEVRRVQKFHETLDNLKLRNSNPVSSNSNAVSVTTQWETFDSGMGSLNTPPPMPSSTNIDQDWERFD